MYNNNRNNARAMNASTAQYHHNEMELKFSQQSAKSLNNTKWLRSNCLMDVELPFNVTRLTIADMERDTAFLNTMRGRYATRIIVDNITTTDAIFKAKGKAVVLNFASYKYPGGGYLSGAKAQEECLCLDSNLYNVLMHLQPIYTMQGTNTQGGVYNTSVFYTPDIIFRNMHLADVITCAAPNRSVALQQGYQDEYINAVMRERIYSILYMAAKYSDCKTLILGAFGCGVFMNIPATVAAIFKEVIDVYFNGVFENIVFAILEVGQGGKIPAFKSVFNV